MRTEAIFRALADPTRLRMMRLLGTMELAVGELAQVLGQSQPRVSRHVGILCDAGLTQRRREGSWTFLRSADGVSGGESTFEAELIGLLATAEKTDGDFAAACQADRRKLAEIRAARDAQAEAYFAQHARDWDELRRMHSSDDEVEAALVDALGEGGLGRLLDIGTGTGRMAELFARRADHIVALDKSLPMLRIARAKLQHLAADRIEVLQGDFTQLPFADDGFDTVLFHQVLHFAPSPATPLQEAARVTRPGGRIAIVDFAPHAHEELRDKHAHTRLGFADAQMRELLDEAGFVSTQTVSLDDGELGIRIWVAHRRPVPDTHAQRNAA